MTSIKDLVESPHPLFSRYLSFYNFLLNSYEGGVDYTKAFITGDSVSSNENTLGMQVYVNGKKTNAESNDNLFKHPKEKDEDYKNRKQMSFYYNFCAPIIDIYIDHLFKQSVVSEFGNIDSIIKFRKDDIDLKNNSISEFRKEMAELSQLYGHIYVISDVPRIISPMYSIQDEIEKNAFPYLSFTCPQNLINWALDAFGNPYWILIRESFDAATDPFSFDRNKTTNTYYKIWTREEWILFDSEYNEIDRGTHNLGFVPITCVVNKRSKKVRDFLGISALADIAFITRDIFNSLSELKQILRDQTFAFLAVQGDASEYDELSVGTTKGLLYPADRNVPQYISPPSSNADTYFSHIDRQVSYIFRLAKLEGGSAKYSGQNAVEQSGVSKAWDFNETNSGLASKAANLEDGESKIWKQVARWRGKKEWDGYVKYPNDFNVKSLNEDLAELEAEARLNLGNLYMIEVKKAIVKKKFPRMPEEIVNKMIKEIEAGVVNQENNKVANLLKRIPKLNQNADSGGKKEE
jgi:hypothetical protein